MVKRDNQWQVNLARQLRKNQTDAEQLLWSKLRSRQLEHARFRRQQAIGPYIIDFVCFEKSLVIEVDGGQHGEDQGKVEDVARDAFLSAEDYRILRFWNNDVLSNIDGVLEYIMEQLSPTSPSP
ncbi:MAG: endonuclease domain-containing protein [Chloroflexi bacterium]|nr:endonuclease domain-containing protein [Chloroflexota bacterium]